MAERRDPNRLDQAMSQSRLGCAVMVGLMMAAVAVAAVVPTVWRLCCEEEKIDGVATVRFRGSYAGDDFPSDNQGGPLRGHRLVIIDAVDAERWWSLLNVGQQERDDYLRASPHYSTKTVTAETVSPIVRATVVTESDGGADIDLPFGSYLICWARSDSGPLEVTVCAEVDVCEDTRVSFGSSWGHDGIGVADPYPYSRDTDQTVAVTVEAAQVSEEITGEATVAVADIGHTPETAQNPVDEIAEEAAAAVAGRTFHVIDEDNREMWWAALGLQQSYERPRLTEVSLTSVFRTMDRDLLESLPAASVVTGADGTGELRVARGIYLICAARPHPDEDRITVCDRFLLRCDSTVRYITDTRTELLVRHWPRPLEPDGSAPH